MHHVLFKQCHYGFSTFAKAFTALFFTVRWLRPPGLFLEPNSVYNKYDLPFGFSNHFKHMVTIIGVLAQPRTQCKAKAQQVHKSVKQLFWCVTTQHIFMPQPFLYIFNYNLRLLFQHHILCNSFSVLSSTLQNNRKPGSL